MSAHDLRVEPVKRRERSTDLRCDTLRTVAYRPVCSCGWIGKARATVRDARIAGIEHRETVGDLH